MLLTGHNGFIGSVMWPMLKAAGHDVVGLDTYLFESCAFGDAQPDLPSLRMDLRDITARQLQGFDAVIHLAALSNDPLGNVTETLPFQWPRRTSTGSLSASRLSSP